MSNPSATFTPSNTRGYVLIHCCVVLFGFTPIMGRLITLNAVPLVWWRMLLAALVLLLVPATWRGIRQMPWRLIGICCLTGVVLAICWALFYLAIKLANASVGAICLGTSPLFVAAAGPVLTRRPYNRTDLLLAAAIIPGIALVVGGVPRGMGLGFVIGLFSAAILTVFSGLNKYLSNRTHPLSSTCLEMAAGALFLALLMALWPGVGNGFLIPDRHDLSLLIVFAVALTALPIALMLVALRDISVFAQQMAVNLEPVYAVVLAVPILGEQQQLDLLFYLGVLVIVGAVMVEPLVQWLRRHPRGGHAVHLR
jgi:drug/metabolite transporter (DMT)-like permease